MISIAIDGPSGAGKSTIAEQLSKELGILHFNTGAIYRAMGLYALNNDIIPDDEHMNRVLGDINIDIQFINGEQHTYLNGQDVSNQLYTSAIADYCSRISSNPQLREYAVDIQRNIANKISVVMEGRDITSTVLPNADYKFFVTATPENRAKRRLNDLKKIGENTTYEEVLADVIERDRRDTTREHSPLILTEDSTLINTDGLSVDEVVQKILSIIKER